MDLSEIFLHILETHHLTQRKASSILQYSSPNHLQRITKKEVSDKLMMDFGERLLIHREELDLTPDEIVSIRQCLFFPSMKKPDYNYAACLFATLCTSVPVSQTKELHMLSFLTVSCGKSNCRRALNVLNPLRLHSAKT